MLARLLLAILAACLSLPAVAMPVSHSAPTEQAAEAMAHDCHKPAKQQDNSASKHDCIGCIARYDGVAAAQLAAPQSGKPPSVRLRVQVPMTRAGPDTPPPRA